MLSEFVNYFRRTWNVSAVILISFEDRIVSQFTCFLNAYYLV